MAGRRGVITLFFSGVGIGVGFMADSGGIGIAGIGSIAPLVESVPQLESIH